MLVLVIDGQGGGVGRALVERLRGRLPKGALLAVGTNAMATSAMLRAGADAGATGENAIAYNCALADILLGPSGIAVPNAMHGEISPAMAAAVQASPAKKLLLSMDRCCRGDAQPAWRSIDEAADDLARQALDLAVRSKG